MNDDWYCEFRDDECGNPQIWFGIDLDPLAYQTGYEKLAELVMQAAFVLQEQLLDDE